MRKTVFLQIVLILLSISFTTQYKRKFRRAHLEVKKKKLFKQTGQFNFISNAFAPQQIHIAFGKKINDIVVIWSTGTKESKMAVQYGTSPQNTFSVVGDLIELNSAAGKSTRYWHRAVLKNLKPHTEYFYRISSKQNGVSSKMLTFTVPSDRFNHVNSFMMIADMGTITRTLPFIVQEAINGKYDAVFHVGDIAYNLFSENGAVGDKFLNSIQPMAASVPYMVSPGDHEQLKDFEHYRYRFSMPNSNWPMKLDKLWYSLDIGAAHFISLNTEVFFSHKQLKDSMMSWLQSDLKAVNSRPNNRPWVIVLGHRPLYSSCDKKDKACAVETTVMRKELEDLFFKEGVDLYLGGHFHNYERTWPVYKGKVARRHYRNPKAPIYITIGSLGTMYIREKLSKSSIPWSAKKMSDGKESFGALDVVNATHLRWKLFDASNNNKLDNAWVIQFNRNRFGDPGEYLESISKSDKAPLPPEPDIGYHVQPLKTFVLRRTRLFKDTSLIIALITVCSFAILLCVFYKRLWRRGRH